MSGKTISAQKFILKSIITKRLYLNAAFFWLLFFSIVLNLYSFQSLAGKNSINLSQIITLHSCKVSNEFLLNGINDSFNNKLVLSDIVEQEIGNENESSNDYEDQLAFFNSKIYTFHFLDFHFNIAISQIIRILNNTNNIPLFILFHSWKSHLN
jgi:predicted MPP superfamily phosphohydrolase